MISIGFAALKSRILFGFIYITMGQCKETLLFKIFLSVAFSSTSNHLQMQLLNPIRNIKTSFGVGMINWRHMVKGISIQKGKIRTIKIIINGDFNNRFFGNGDWVTARSSKGDMHHEMQRL